MPFDATTVRKPVVTILPPTPVPPERGGGPRRIHIEIEIIERRAPQRATRGGYRFGTITLVLLVLAVLMALAGCGAAHAQQRYEHWQSTDGWHGQTRTEGSTTDWTAYGPHGEQKHCHRYFVGDQPYTNCN